MGILTFDRPVQIAWVAGLIEGEGYIHAPNERSTGEVKARHRELERQRRARRKAES